MERIIDTNYAITSGNIFEVRNNGALRFAVSYNGAIFATSFTFPSLTLSGNLQVDGNSIIGNAVGDTLTVNATPTFKEITTFEKAITAQAALGISGVITSSNTTSTNISTASIVTAGGIGVAKAIFVGEDLDVNGATTLNTLNTSGNTSIAGNLEVLGTTTLKNVVYVESSTLEVDDASIELGKVAPVSGLSGTISASTTSYNITGMSTTSKLIPGMALSKTGGAGLLGTNARISSILSTTSISVTADDAATAGAINFDVAGPTNYTADSGGFIIEAGADGDKQFLWSRTEDKFVSSEGIKISDTTSSTTKDTGSIILEGGLGVEENINTGGNIVAGGTLSSVGKLSTTNTTQATTTSDGSINTPGGISCAKDIYCGGSLIGPNDRPITDITNDVTPPGIGSVSYIKVGRVVTVYIRGVTTPASALIGTLPDAVSYPAGFSVTFPSCFGNSDGILHYTISNTTGEISAYGAHDDTYGTISYISAS